MARLILLVNLFLSCWVMVGCSQSVSPDDYFPTQEGLSWRYAIKHEMLQESWTDWMTIRTVDKGTVYFEDKTQMDLPRRRTSSGTDYYILKNEEGIYRAARRLIVENKPKVDPKVRMIVPQGKNLKLGFVWAQEGTPYAVQWQPPFSEMNASIKPFDMLFEIGALKDSVSTPAGDFDDCIRIDGFGKMVVYADPRTGYREVEISQKEWYCAGVGLVKLIRDEPLKLDIITGGTVTLLLTKFEQ